MEKIVTSELARQIASNLIAQTWGWWLSAVIAWIVMSAALTYFKSFTTKSGEIKAISVNMQKVLDQLDETTTLTKSIETSISHDDWAKREWKTLRRIKLESIADQLTELGSWGARLPMDLVKENEIEDNLNFYKLKSTVLMYFQELRTEVDALENAFDKLILNYLNAITECRKTRDRSECDSCLQQKASLLTNDCANFHLAIIIFQRKLPEILETIMPR